MGRVLPARLGFVPAERDRREALARHADSTPDVLDAARRLAGEPADRLRTLPFADGIAALRRHLEGG